MQNGVAEGKVDKEKVKHLPAIIIGLGMGLGIQWTLEPELFDIDEMEVSFKDLVLAFLK